MKNKYFALLWEGPYLNMYEASDANRLRELIMEQRGEDNSSRVAFVVKGECYEAGYFGNAMDGVTKQIKEWEEKDDKQR